MLGKNIFIEGSDFSGKTTLITQLKEYFSDIFGEERVDVRRQPGATELGTECRRLLFGLNTSRPNELMADRLLFAVDHTDFMRDLLENKKKDVLTLCDRYSPLSNVIYASAYEMNAEDMAMLTKVTSKGFTPDLVICLGVSSKCFEKRKEARMIANGEINKIDLKGNDFFEKIRSMYRGEVSEYIESYDYGNAFDNIVFLDTSEKTPDKVFEEVKGIIYKRLVKKID